MKKAFSLVELSLVLVILGLLVGGILAGKSLIRASELRSVMSDYNRYTTAVQAFRDRYFALPGDMTNATAVWGQSTNCGGAVTNGTCNGNGDNILSAGAANATGEIYQFWNQLALAGLIEGTYTGIAGPVGGADAIPGTNVPAARLQSGGWGVYNMGNFAGAGWAYQYNYGGVFVLGSRVSGSIPDGTLIKPEEAWNIDSKIDDGYPSTGKIISNWSSCTTSANFSDYTGVYNVSSSTVSCFLFFPKLF